MSDRARGSANESDVGTAASVKTAKGRHTHASIWAKAEAKVRRPQLQRSCPSAVRAAVLAEGAAAMPASRWRGTKNPSKRQRPRCSVVLPAQRLHGVLLPATLPRSSGGSPRLPRWVAKEEEELTARLRAAPMLLGPRARR